jgi:hypothetical protein
MTGMRVRTEFQCEKRRCGMGSVLEHRVASSFAARADLST